MVDSNSTRCVLTGPNSNSDHFCLFYLYLKVENIHKEELRFLGQSLENQALI